MQHLLVSSLSSTSDNSGSLFEDSSKHVEACQHVMGCATLPLKRRRKRKGKGPRNRREAGQGKGREKEEGRKKGMKKGGGMQRRLEEGKAK